MRALFKKLGIAWIAAIPSTLAQVTVVLDSMPTRAEVGAPLTLEFTLRQNDAPFISDTVLIWVNYEGSAQKTVFVAQARGARGHYVAKFPKTQAGVLNWSVQPAVNLELPMPAVTIEGDAVTHDTTISESSLNMNIVQGAAGVASLIGLIGLSALVLRVKRTA